MSGIEDSHSIALRGLLGRGEKSVLSARYVFGSILSLALGVVACNPSDVGGDTAVAQPSVTVDGHDPSPRPRFVRLTHPQWELSIQEIFAFEEPTGLSQTSFIEKLLPRATKFLFIVYTVENQTN